MVLKFERDKLFAQWNCKQIIELRYSILQIIDNPSGEYAKQDFNYLYSINNDLSNQSYCKF